MEELDKGIDLSMRGGEAEEALRVARLQFDEWGLTMPAVEPLVFDFGLGDFANVGEIEYWITNELDAGYCGKFLFVRDGQTCPMHRHEKKHETFYIVKGRVRMHFDGTQREMTEGGVLAVPPNEMHSFTGVGPALLLEVSMPCVVDDNFFENRDIPYGLNYKNRNAE